MPSESEPDRDDLGSALRAARVLSSTWSDPQFLTLFIARVEEVYRPVSLAPSLTQALLKNLEIYDAILDVAEHARGSVGMMLSRTLLENAAMLQWAAVPPDAQERQTRLIRIVVKTLQENSERYPDIVLPDAYASLVSSAEDLGLKGPPNARGAMHEVDKELVRRGDKPFFESHYSHYQLASSHLHSPLFGPATFSGPADGPLRWSNRDERFLVRASVRYGTRYFVLVWQAVARLVDREELVTAVQQHASVPMKLADEALHRAGRLTPSGWVVR